LKLIASEEEIVFKSTIHILLSTSQTKSIFAFNSIVSKFLKKQYSATGLLYSKFKSANLVQHKSIIFKEFASL